jgi:hypothetical protein
MAARTTRRRRRPASGRATARGLGMLVSVGALVRPGKAAAATVEPAEVAKIGARVDLSEVRVREVAKRVSTTRESVPTAMGSSLAICAAV